MSFPAPTPHAPIVEIAPEVFLLRGSVKLNPIVRITRNTVILRHDDELTLVHPVRMEPAEEARLEALGTVKRLLRLGPLHGLDDPYYLDRYDAELWASGESDVYPEPKIDRILAPGADLPFPGARLFHIEGSKQPEAVMRLDIGGGLLVTCDAIQHYGDYEHNNLPARLLMPFIGFPKTTVVGPIWVKMMTPEGGSLEGSFRTLLGTLAFDDLIAAHGSFLQGGAHAAVTRAVDKMFSG